jgi:hypothetical protein
MSDAFRIAIDGYVFFGLVVAWISAFGWGRYKLLHLAPFVYAFVGYSSIKLFQWAGQIQWIGHSPHAFDWKVPLGLGGMYYVFAWLTTLERLGEKKHQPIARPPPGEPRTFTGDDPGPE